MERGDVAIAGHLAAILQKLGDPIFNNLANLFSQFGVQIGVVAPESAHFEPGSGILVRKKDPGDEHLSQIPPPTHTHTLADRH